MLTVPRKALQCSDNFFFFLLLLLMFSLLLGSPSSLTWKKIWLACKDYSCYCASIAPRVSFSFY